MKIKLLATSQSPDYYVFSGETITAYHEGIAEVYDLSTFPEGGIFEGADPVNGVTAIRGVSRANGVLSVQLCQQVGPGHWSESDYFDAATYDPDAVHVEIDVVKDFAGIPWAKTIRGRTFPLELHHYDMMIRQIEKHNESLPDDGMEITLEVTN